MLISGVLQAALVGGDTFYAGVMTFFRALRLDNDVRRFFKALIPATVGSAGTQLALFADTIIASFLSAGAISALYYADRIDQLPIGVIGIAVGTVLVPEMTHRLAAGDEAGARSAQNRAIEFALLLAIPCVVGFLVGPGLIMRALFMRGAFTAADAHAAAMTLMAYTIGLIPFVLIRSVVAPFYARGDTATPVKAALVGTAINIVFKIMLMVPLAQVGWRSPPRSAPGSISSWCSFFAAPCARHRRRRRTESFAREACRRRSRAHAGSVDRRPARHATVIVMVQVPQRIGTGVVGLAWRHGLWGTGAGVVWSALGIADETKCRECRSRADFIRRTDRGSRSGAGSGPGPIVMQREQETPCV